MLVKDIFNNWIELHMCGDYCPVNKDPFKQICHALSEKIFDALGQAKV
jgi:hypothetical protein